MDDFLSGLDATQRAAFEHILDLVREMVPDAEEGTAYGAPALRYRQKPFIGFAAPKHHLSIFPFSSHIVDAVSDRLKEFELSKGTIRFTVDKPLPDEVLREVVRLRVSEIAGSAR